MKSPQKQPKKPFEPVIKKPPTIATKAELFAFLNAESHKTLRPLAKVVAITDSIAKRQTFDGTLTRKRVGPKDQSLWKNFIEAPTDPYFHVNIKNYLVNDPKIKDTKPVSPYESHSV